MGREESYKEAMKFLSNTGFQLPAPQPMPLINGVPNKPMYVTPDELFIHFQAYRVDCKATPFLTEDFGMSKLGAEKVTLHKERPLTLEGFSVWLWEKGITKSFRAILDNQKNLYEAYIEVCLYIRESIRQDQIEGGMSGVYNPSITARLNGLADKTENKNVNINKNFNISMDLT